MMFQARLRRKLPNLIECCVPWSCNDEYYSKKESTGVFKVHMIAMVALLVDLLLTDRCSTSTIDALHID